ncbi:MAG: alkaline phosphatase D family protein [Bacteroidota bacterium]
MAKSRIIKAIPALILFATSLATFAQKAALLAGPMPGYTEHRETVIWLQTECAKKVTIEYWEENRTDKKSVTQLATGCAVKNHHFVLGNLKMGTTYAYRILVDEKPHAFNYPLTFKTKPLWEWRTDAPDFNFLLGSCLYVNDSAYDRPGSPYGQGTEILLKMNEKKSDFMLWLGDNVYTREADFGSESGLKYRYQHTRADKNLQPFLASRHHYATWDDHDYGNNDACKTYSLKEVTRQLFQDYWANKTYGQNAQGVYSMFSYSDADFFMLDDRWFRDYQFISEKTNPDKTQLGEVQIQWLFNNLSQSRAAFKFVVVGGQFLNEHTTKESYNFYKTERGRILDFIIENKISGVVFLTGDRHLSELIKNEAVQPALGYSLYDFTCSAISSRTSDISKLDEFTNPTRVANTLVMENNFGNISISGAKGKRVLTLQCFDKNGLLKWEHKIGQDELKARK